MRIEAIELKALIQKHDPTNSKSLVVFCLGTDTCIGDAIAPLVGTALRGKQFANLEVQGTLVSPITYREYDALREMMETTHTSDKYVRIVIDAGLGNSSQIGDIILRDGGLVPGKAFGHVIPGLGDIGIIACVNNISNIYSNYVQLQNTSLFFVTRLAEEVADMIVGVYYELGRRHW